MMGDMPACPAETLGAYALQKPLGSETSRGCVDEETHIQITNT